MKAKLHNLISFLQGLKKNWEKSYVLNEDENSKNNNVFYPMTPKLQNPNWHKFLNGGFVCWENHSKYFTLISLREKSQINYEIWNISSIRIKSHLNSLFVIKICKNVLAGWRAWVSWYHIRLQFLFLISIMQIIGINSCYSTMDSIIWKVLASSEFVLFSVISIYG